MENKTGIWKLKCNKEYEIYKALKNNSNILLNFNSSYLYDTAINALSSTNCISHSYYKQVYLNFLIFFDFNSTTWNKFYVTNFEFSREMNEVDWVNVLCR